MPTPEIVEVLVPSSPQSVEVLVPSSPQSVEVFVAGGGGPVADDSVTNLKLANMAANRVKGTIVAGDPADLTPTEVTSILQTFSPSLKGLVPASGGGPTKFLNAEGSFEIPAGTGGVSGDTYFPPSGLERTLDSKLDEYVSFTDFMIAAESDTSQAWLRFGAWAKAQSAAGKGVELYLPPGLYLFNHEVAWGCLLSIRKLKIKGYGATVTNTYDPPPDNFGFQIHFPVPYSASDNLTVGYKINNVAPYDTTVTLKTPSDHSHFTVGCSMLVGSMDIQGYGQPLNVDRFDYVTVTAINTSTGVITFTPALTNYHRDDFADWENQPVTGQWGKARIYALDSITGSALYDSFWDVKHDYEGFEITQLPAIAEQYYMNCSGRFRSFTNMKLPALSESMTANVRGSGCFFTGLGETDKIVDQLAYDSCVWNQAITYQSSSLNHASLKNCQAPGLNCGTAKSVYAENCDFGYWGSGAHYGRGRTRVAVGCKIANVTYSDVPVGAYESLLTVDGTAVSYANGVFTQSKVSADPIFNLSPGQACHWQTSAGIFTHDIGSFYVLRVYDDATNIYIETTCPLAVKPSWASGKILANRTGSISFIECYGGDNTRRMSEATKAGERVGEYFKDIFVGRWASGGYWYGRGGILKRVVITVHQSTPVAGSLFGFDAQMFTANAVDDYLPFNCNIDITIKGRRDFTLAALTGKVGTDAVLLNSVAQTMLPASRVVSSSTQNWFTSGVNLATAPIGQLPVVEVEMYFDCGMYLRPLVAYEAHESGSIIGAVTGSPHP